MSRRWSPPAKGFALLAVVFAGAAFALVRGYAARAHAVSSSLGHPVPVAVASTWLPRGTVLKSDMFRVTEVPSAYAPPQAVGDPATATGRILLAPMRLGEPL